MRYPRIFYLVISLLLALLAEESFAVESQPVDLPGLDSVSASCIFCHNGGDGAHAGFCLLSQGDKQAAGHVISVSYAELAKHNQGIRPIDGLPAEIVLDSGKITCATCHGNDPHDHTPLVIDNSGSALCLTCHLK